MMGFFDDLRRAAAGALVGARLALGPKRWAALRAVWRVLGWLGWLVLAAWAATVLAVLAGAL